ncbi:MAG: helix-turn-helix transcriptional regulator [Bacteroidetes bacterium]|nr:MAG: helix-turn-helix transcriptional regulator [Bacteroidota bacterium]
MKLNKKEVAQNLRLFGYKKFGTMKRFAEALEMNPSTLYSGYLNGRSLPGPVLLVKLIDLGCNINWLLTGRETMTVQPSGVDMSVRTPLLSTPMGSDVFIEAKKTAPMFADQRR